MNVPVGAILYQRSTSIPRLTFAEAPADRKRTAEACKLNLFHRTVPQTVDGSGTFRSMATKKNPPQWQFDLLHIFLRVF